MSDSETSSEGTTDGEEEHRIAGGQGLALDDLPEPEYEGKVGIESLTVDGQNPNSMNDDTFSLLCQRMRDRGWTGSPIVTDTSGCIADGQHRWMAAKEIGLEEVPVKQYAMTDEERRLLRQEMNKIEGEHDEKRDALEFDKLAQSSVKEDMMDLLDARDESLDEYLEMLREPPTDRRQPLEFNVEHDIYFRDCVSGMQEEVGGDSVDLILTDPPYGIDIDLESTMGSTGVSHIGDLENDELEDALAVFANAAAEMRRVLKPDGHCYVFASWKTYDKFRDILEETGFNVKNCLVWCKSTPNNQPSFGTGGVNYGLQHEFILYATLEDGDPRSLDRVMSDLILHKHNTTNNEHPTEKPVGLLDIFVDQSTDEGDVVLDPFIGSGSTAVAAVQNERDAIGFEIDGGTYRPIIERRIDEAKRELESASHQGSVGESASSPGESD